MQISIKKVYYTVVMYDLDGEFEHFFRKKKDIKKLKKKYGKNFEELIEEVKLDEIKYNKDEKYLCTAFKLRPVVVLNKIEGKNKYKVCPIYSYREKYKTDEYCYKLKESIYGEKDSFVDVSREFNIKAKYLFHTEKYNNNGIGIKDIDFENIVDIFLNKMAPKKHKRIFKKVKNKINNLV